ncbi:MAG: sigma-70 family RNA polymerase sigma factor [Acidobacteriota bacterium]
MEKNNSLSEKLKNKDSKAELSLIKKYNSRLFTYFKSRIKGESNYEDLVQEVFTSFFEAVGKDKIREDNYIAPFIFGIAKRVVYNYFYKKKRGQNIKKKAEEEHISFYNFEEENKIENKKMIEVINKYLDNLKEIDKIILKNFYLLEKTIEEISIITKKTKHYVSVRKERALKKIKNEIFKSEDVYK